MIRAWPAYPSAVTCGAGDGGDVVVDRPDVVAGLLRRLLGETDGRHLGIGEGDLRDRLVVGGGDVQSPRCIVHRAILRASRDHLSRGTRLVLALMGQQGTVVHVADGVEPRVVLVRGGRGEQSVVDGDPVAILESRRLARPRSSVRGVRPVATSTSSAVTVLPSSSSITTEPPASRAGRDGDAPSCTYGPGLLAGLRRRARRRTAPSRRAARCGR